MVAKVFSPNGVDLGRRLVSAGWALAYRRYSMDYVAAENEARKGHAGGVPGHLRAPDEVARTVTAATRAAIHAGLLPGRNGSRLDRDLQSIAMRVGAGHRVCGTRAGRADVEHKVGFSARGTTSMPRK